MMVETEVKFEISLGEYMNLEEHIPDYFVQRSSKLLVDVITNVREVDRGNGRKGNDFDRIRIVLNDNCLDKIVGETKEWRSGERVETPMQLHQVKKQRTEFWSEEIGVTICLDKLYTEDGYRYFLEVEKISKSGGAEMKDFVVRFAREELEMGDRPEAPSYLKILGIVK